MVKHFATPSKARQKGALRLLRPLKLKGSSYSFGSSDTRFRRLVDHMNEAVWVGDKNELTVYANPKFCEIMGYSLAEMLGKPSYIFWTKESAERVRQVNETDRKRGVSSSYEGDLLTKTGQKIPVLLSGTPLPSGGTIGIMTDLREIKKREIQVENLLNRFDLAVRGSNDGLWYTEIPIKSLRGKPDWNRQKDHYLWFSPRFKEILGYSDNEFPDSMGTWMSRIHPEDFSRVMGSVWAALTSRSNFETEYRIKHKDGEYRWCATRGEAKLGSEGSQLFVAGSFRDITERKRTRDALTKQVREAQLLFRANGHMRMVIPIRKVFADLAKDLDFACRETPNAYTYVEFDGKVFSKIMVEGRVGRKITETITVRGRRRGVIELRYLKSSRFGESVFNDDRQALMTLGTFIRKHVSSREIMERYQSLVKKSVMGIFIMQDGMFKFVNPKLARIFRVSGSHLVGRRYEEFVSDNGFFKKNLKACSQKNCRYFAKTRSEEGEEALDLEIHAQPIDYHGMNAILGTVADVTKMKKAEKKIHRFNQELRQKVTEKTRDLEVANRRLKSLNELKDEFIAVTSHELRSPLTAIRGYLSIMVEDKDSLGRLPENIRDYIVRVYDNAEVLNNLVNNILDVSRIETGRLELYPKPTGIADMMRQTIRNFEYQMGEKGITASFENRLPNPDLLLDLDTTRIRQVLRNIMDNAIKYSQSGKKISVVLEMKGIGVQISISDEGIGIPKSQLFEVFEKFKQGKNAQSAYKGGAGLGLFIAKRIMELHGGMIWAESQLNKGTTFHLQLPLRESQVSEEAENQ